MERAQGPAGLADGLRRNKTCEIPMASAVCGAGRGGAGPPAGGDRSPIAAPQRRPQHEAPRLNGSGTTTPSSLCGRIALSHWVHAHRVHV